MALKSDVELGVGDGVIAADSRGATSFGVFRLVQVAILGLTIGGVVVGLRITVPHGTSSVDAVAFGLTLLWALVGFVDLHARERVGSRVSGYHLLAGVDALVAMVALTAGRKA
ncbi:MAG TPA: hypothetical protein VIX84_12910, partial [Acidimicrobiales bacterium]